MAMVPWEVLDSAPMPGSGEVVRLYRRGSEYSIRVDRIELMNSRLHGSEDALAQLACTKVAARPRPRVLIGGLGMGYTLAAALRCMGPKAEVVVAELVPAVVTWNRGPLAGLAGRPLADRRVKVREIDVAAILLAERQEYDAILMDVDNGPEGLARKENQWLYATGGLAATFSALRPGGVLTIWSSGPHRTFTQLLRRASFQVEEIRVPARGAAGGRPHTIWLAERAA